MLAICHIKDPCLEVCVIAYPELGEVLADPKIKFEENPFRVRCGGRIRKLKKRFLGIKQVFIE